VLYLLLVAHELGIEGYERILAVIVLTVLLSVFAHGVSAVPLSHRYGNSSAKVSRT
jgi:NhaP-type Na+/H+ or K+/H+ antiporter